MFSRTSSLKTFRGLKITLSPRLNCEPTPVRGSSHDRFPSPLSVQQKMKVFLVTTNYSVVFHRPWVSSLIPITQLTTGFPPRNDSQRFLRMPQAALAFLQHHGRRKILQCVLYKDVLRHNAHRVAAKKLPTHNMLNQNSETAIPTVDSARVRPTRQCAEKFIKLLSNFL